MTPAPAKTRRLFLSDEDKAALNTFDRLKAFCERELGAGRRRGNELVFPCPFGSHRRPHLSVAVRDGRGVWRCRACNVGGDVFKLASLMRGFSFPDAAGYVAEATGYGLQGAPQGGSEAERRAARERYARRCQKARQEALQALQRPVPAAPEFLTRREDEALACLERARRPGALERHAGMLGIPAAHLRMHADFPEYGGVGLSEDGRLAYVYTARDDAGRIRSVALKVRNAPGHKVRFQFLAGKPCVPFGVVRLEVSSGVILTEGESDALAVGAALEAYREAWEAGPEPGEEAGVPADALPAVIAAPGTSGFAAARPWLYGRRVMICCDNDESGRIAVQQFNVSQGETNIRMWTPPPGVKDARAAYVAAASPFQFTEELLTTFFS